MNNEDSLSVPTALFNKGVAIFGNANNFHNWLKKPFYNSKETPMEWIIKSGGIELLIEELDRLAQGYPV
jgi:uncharacterized protein (DUF2384 family)